jgi:hypothetical protein
VSYCRWSIWCGVRPALWKFASEMLPSQRSTGIAPLHQPVLGSMERGVSLDVARLSLYRLKAEDLQQYCVKYALLWRLLLVVLL